jgi:hypoxanthine phosphoribosyltransferase
MLTRDEVLKILKDGEEIVSAEEVNRAVHRIATEIEAALSDKQPLVLSIMGGAVVFTGQLLPLLNFPLDFDSIHVTRYGDEIRGGQLKWKLAPRENVSGRVVLLLDDILDEGHTLAETREMVMKLGAKEVYCAVFTDKNIGRAKPIKADFVGITLPNRFVFGFGMDVQGAWRNLPAIYAMKEDSSS